MWVLGIERGTSGRTVNALIHWAITPASTLPPLLPCFLMRDLSVKLAGQLSLKDPRLFSSPRLGLQACTTMPSFLTYGVITKLGSTWLFKCHPCTLLIESSARAIKFVVSCLVVFCLFVCFGFCLFVWFVFWFFFFNLRQIRSNAYLHQASTENLCCPGIPRPCRTSCLDRNVKSYS